MLMIIIRYGKFTYMEIFNFHLTLMSLLAAIYKTFLSKTAFQENSFLLSIYCYCRFYYIHYIPRPYHEIVWNINILINHYLPFVLNALSMLFGAAVERN